MNNFHFPVSLKLLKDKLLILKSVRTPLKIHKVKMNSSKYLH